MNDTRAHLKLTVQDIYNCNAANDGESFFCTLFSEKSQSPTRFQNVRIHGLVIQKNGFSFAVDDGTGVIAVKVPQDSYIEIPNISDYVEVLGKLKIIGRTERSILALSCSKRNEPMEEIHHLLEQAEIHKNYSEYRKFKQQAFLSSETNTPNIYDDYTSRVTKLFENCDRSKGLKEEDIQKECDNDLSIAKKVIESLINNTEIYHSKSKNSYFPI